MKNFRKVLALVLVVATLFSFAAMASAKYEDADKISYEMAVDILSAVGILNGYEVAEDEFEFKPTNTITREEMAKMIAVMANATDDISKLYASANTFADVEADRWSASYISYCAHTGIVAGRTADTFDPTGKVTGLETAKMLLVVMGFDAEEQGYVGANWKVNVLRDAKNAGLLANFDANYDIDVAITREEAANMMLNALLGNVVVGVLSDDIVKITNAAFINRFGVIVNADLIDSDKTFINLYGNVIVSRTTVAEALYGDNLELDQYWDCFLRDTLTFEFYKDGKLAASGSYAVGADLTSTEPVALGTVYAAEVKNGYTFTVIENGQYIGDEMTAAAAAAYTGNGVDTAIYVHPAEVGQGGEIEVNVIKNTIGQVTAVSDYYGTFTVKTVDGNGTSFHSGITEVEEVAVNDYIIFTACDAAEHEDLYGTADPLCVDYYALHEYYVVKPVVETVAYARNYVDGTEHDSCYFTTTEGKDYKYNAYYGEWLNNDNVDVPVAGGKYNVYLDKYGYVKLTTPVAATTYVAYIEEGSESQIAAGSEMNVDGSWTYEYEIGLDAYNADKAAGAIEAADIKTADTALVDGTLLYWYNALKNVFGTGALVSYTVDADGLAVLSAGAGYVSSDVISKDTETVEVLNVETYALTEETAFIIRYTNPADGTWTYEEVIGRKALKEAYVVSDVKTAAGQTTGATTAQVMDTNADGKADYVFIDAQFVKVATEFFLMSGKYTASWTGIAGLDLGSDDNQYHAYRALVNGVDSLVLFEDEQTIATNGAVYTGAIAYQGVVMTPDGELNLYVDKSSEGVKTVYKSYGLYDIDIEVIGGEVWVNLRDSSANGFKSEIAGTDNLPVYHIMKPATLNGKTGFWTQYNAIDTELVDETGFRAFVVRNAADKITAIYVVHAGWNA